MTLPGVTPFPPEFAVESVRDVIVVDGGYSATT